MNARICTGAAVMVTASLGFWTATVSAQEEGVPTLEQLEQRIRVLERQLEIADEDAAAMAKTTAVPVADERGFALRSADNSFELKFRLLAQGDARFLEDSTLPPFNDTFGMRRLRPIIEASLGKLIGVRLTPEFAGAGATIVDAYLDLKLAPLYTVRVGKMKGPVGLERLQSGGSTMFIERAYPTELAPNRDIGLVLQGDYDGGVFSYALGIFNGAADGRDAAATDVDDEKEIAGRVFFEPFRNSPGWLQGLGFGVAGSSGDKVGTSVGQGGVLPQYRTPAQIAFFQYATGVAASGKHERLTAHSYWYRYSLGVMGEYIESSQELTAAGGTAQLTHSAWQVSAAYVLTGEDETFRGVIKPKSSFVRGAPGFGAWEVVARVSELDPDDDAFPVFANPATAASRARTYGAGVNWYLTPNAKVMLDYLHTEFQGGAAAGADRADENVVLGRFQVTH
ncbi:MAG TPA: porin [Steroidobacteraceae bacterium]|nr:porin [Steroidobacteraceae bacterium]